MLWHHITPLLSGSRRRSDAATCSTEANKRKHTMKLLDDDGENKAVRWFLACYGGGGNKTIGTMKLHLEMSGFSGCWPEWCNTEHPSQHLTKGGAQLWLRYLFDLEKTAA